MPPKHANTHTFALTRQQLVLLAGAALLVCGLFFSLGLLSGYFFFASSLRRKLPEAEQVQKMREESEKASFYQTLTDEKTPVPQLRPQAPAREQGTPAPEAPSPYKVQVGAFRQEKEARALQERLQKKGYQAQVLKAQLKDKGIWFRVRVGNCADKEQAQALAEQLRKREHLPTLIVK